MRWPPFGNYMREYIVFRSASPLSPLELLLFDFFALYIPIAVSMIKKR